MCAQEPARTAASLALAAALLPASLHAAQTEPPFDLFETQRLMLSAGGERDEFGAALALTGEWLVAGAPESFSVGGQSYRGKVDVFSLSAAQWQHDAQLEAAFGENGDHFGSSAAIEGDVVVIGAPSREISGAFSAGSAYVFERLGSTWFESSPLQASDFAQGMDFGDSVAILDDTIFVGAVFGHGWAYVFERSGSSWVETGRLEPGLGGDSSSNLGSALDAEAGRVVCGAEGYDGLGHYDAGSVYVFEPFGSGWVERHMLTAGDPSTSGNFGQSVALDGDTLAVGGHASAYVFEWDGVNWVEGAKLVPASAPPAYSYGASIATDGDRVVVGEPSTGRAVLFARTPLGWVETGEIFSSDGAGNEFGAAAAWHADTLAIGAPGFDFQGTDTGATYVFHAGELYERYCVAAPNSTGLPAAINALGTSSLASDDMTLLAFPVPPLQNGLFFYGTDATQVAFGDGFRCVGGGAAGIARLPIVSSNVNGLLRHVLDTGAPPTAATQITAGATWRFQAWFRDPGAGGAFFNTSDAFAVTFGL